VENRFSAGNAIVGDNLATDIANQTASEHMTAERRWRLLPISVTMTPAM
jgi:hypothetical protein